MKPIYLVVLLVLAVASSLYYRAEEIETRMECQETVAEINRLSAESKKQSEDKIHDLETDRIAQNQDAELRIQALAKRLNIVRRAKPTSALGTGMCDCSISDDAVVVLAETASDPYLKPPKHSSCLVAESGAVTTDNLSEYAFTTIENYNSCARQLNSLIDVVGALYKNSP